MAKLGLEVVNVLPRLDQKAGVGVAEVMKPEWWATCGLQCWTIVAPEHILVIYNRPPE
jgi:hypothetical protein